MYVNLIFVNNFDSINLLFPITHNKNKLNDKYDIKCHLLSLIFSYMATIII